ncbi:MAG: arylsulfatase [Verrucomicrobia bacterium]|nr:arylsulfatase [Verrucomicrobiota bacterium]
MKPRTFAALSLLLLAPLAAPAADTRPNIIFIMADDLGYGDVGCFGQKEIRTPNLDRLAAQGTRFTDAHAGATVCAPSRCTLMTGNHNGHARVRGNAAGGNAQSLDPGDITIASVLKDAGYTTALCGKWGLGDFGAAEAGLPTRHGFDLFFGYLNQTHAHNSFPTFLVRNETKVPLPNLVPNETPVGAGISSNKAVFSGDLMLKEALDFVRTNRAKPFFLYFSPTLPHANNESKPLGLEVPDQGEYAKRDWPEFAKWFAAMVTRLDRDVGQLLDLLKELGLEQNTLVIFSSDNGPHKEGGQDPAFFKSWGPLRGTKRDLYEGGIRVPTIARWPGRIPAGATSAATWYFGDLLPTFAEVAGAKAPAGRDGVSILPALLGRPQPELATRYLYWEFHEGGFKQAARRGDWKAVRVRLGAPLELYQLAADLGEQTNVAAQHADIVAEFEKYFATARTDSPHWPLRAAGTKKGK